MQQRLRHAIAEVSSNPNFADQCVMPPSPSRWLEASACGDECSVRNARRAERRCMGKSCPRFSYHRLQALFRVTLLH